MTLDKQLSRNRANDVAVAEQTRRQAIQWREIMLRPPRILSPSLEQKLRKELKDLRSGKKDYAHLVRPPVAKV